MSKQNSKPVKDQFSNAATVKAPAKKVIGMLGGLGWASTKYAYEMINEEANTRLGDGHTVEIALYSMNQGDAMVDMEAGNWAKLGKDLAAKAKVIEAAGADFLYMPCNTLHQCAEDIRASVKIPFIHMVDSVAAAIKAQNIKKIALMGTQYTMDLGFYKDKLQNEHGIEVILPEKEDQKTVHRIIFDELTQNKIVDASRDEYLRIMRSLQARGAQGVIAGCTEIGLLVKQKHIEDFPLFDSDAIHSKRALDIALGAEPELFARRAKPSNTNVPRPARKKGT